MLSRCEYIHILGGMCHDIQNVVWMFDLISQVYMGERVRD